MKKATKILYISGFAFFLFGAVYNIIVMINVIVKAKNAEPIFPPKFTVGSFTYEIISILILFVATAIFIFLSIKKTKSSSASICVGIFYLLSFLAELFLILPTITKYIILFRLLSPLGSFGLSIVPFSHLLASGSIFRAIGSGILLAVVTFNFIKKGKRQLLKS